MALSYWPVSTSFSMEVQLTKENMKKNQEKIRLEFFINNGLVQNYNYFS
jgi:hypothetical protein